jgi:hypothetical protein
MTRHEIRGRVRALAVAAGLLIAIPLAGCFNPFDPLVARARGVSVPPPNPSRPELAVRLFEWCWDHRAITEYEEIFTDDFQFQFAATDTAGNAFRGHALTRFDEIETARHLFVGGSSAPPANSISLELDQNLIPQQDSRAGKQDTTYHQEIDTQVVLSIETDEESFRVTGTARFFLVRGDSAAIPAEMVAKGFRRDPQRWYIERWEDETVGSAGASARRVDPGMLSNARRAPGSGALEPSREGAVEYSPLDVSWGFVKRVYYPRH